MADGNRMLLAELFPELPAADLDLLATSGTIEQDIDDFLQSRLTPEAKLVELRSHKAAPPSTLTPAPAAPAAAPASWGLPFDFFTRGSTPRAPGPAFGQPLPGMAQGRAAPFVPRGPAPAPAPPHRAPSLRQTSTAPSVMPTTGFDADLAALQRVFGSVYSEAQIRACMVSHKNNLLAVARELVLNAPAPAAPAPVSNPPPSTTTPAVPSLPRSVSQDQTLTDASLLAVLLASVPACQRFTEPGLARLAMALVPCTVLSAIDMLRSVPSGQEQAFIAEYGMASMDEGPSGASAADPGSGMNCVICLEEKPVDEMAFLTCDHAFCYPDFKQHVTTAIESGSLPTCPSCPDTRRLTQDEALMPFADDPMSVTIGKIEEAYLRVGLSEVAAIPCPRPGCQNAVVPRIAGRKEHCVCECGFEFCSLCREIFHYDTSCAEVRAAAGRWDAWVQTGREETLRAKAREDATWKARLDEYQHKKDKHSRENQDAMRRRAELGRDEDWKEQNCRLCPNCGRCIERMSGCDSMMCGADAHGGNAQNGCGRAFNWNSAKRYVKSVTGGPAVPEFAETAPERANTDITIAEGITLTCDMCRGPITGLGFRCVNCPGQFSVCLACESRVTAGAHNGHHIFRALRHGAVAAEAAAAEDDFNVIALDD